MWRDEHKLETVRLVIASSGAPALEIIAMRLAQ
jgi:hypothetical protein